MVNIGFRQTRAIKIVPGRAYAVIIFKLLFYINYFYEILPIIICFFYHIVRIYDTYIGIIEYGIFYIVNSKISL